MTEKLKIAFNEAMLHVYRSALAECDYRATRFLQLVETHGGVAAARQLLQSTSHPEGLTKLWELGRLDLSMEALVLKDPWKSLFTEDELRIALKRLRDLGYR